MLDADGPEFGSQLSTWLYVVGLALPPLGTLVSFSINQGEMVWDEAMCEKQNVADAP